jgi:non-canonical (house-cleaning) NTP pyrophosphatase
LPDDKRADLKNSLIQDHLNKITASDAVLIFNKDKNGVANYIGGNTLMEMAFAYAQGIEIFLLNAAPDQGYTDEILGMKPIILGGNVEKIDDYFKQLPKTFVSSKSPVKLRAVSRGMRRAGIRTRVIAKPTESNVAEQPRDIDETYEGAQNRHSSLKKLTVNDSPTYFATVESGLYTAHPKHNVFSSTVTIIEKVGQKQKVGISVELEYPKEMTDKVPSVYPDLGVLVQEEYGSELKDPFPFFTHGKLDQLKLVENAMFNVAVQLEEE